MEAARADRMPKLDLGGGVTRYKYPAAVTPLYVTSTGTVAFPEFTTTLYDAGAFLTLPLYRGGRLDRSVAIAELRKNAAEDLFRVSRQELIYNLTSTYYKVLQLGKFVEANEEQVKRLEAHKRDVEFRLQAGTVAKVDLLRAETELAHAHQALLVSRNSLASAKEFLKTLMGVEDMNRELVLASGPGPVTPSSPIEQSIAAALSQRPVYQAAVKYARISEERVSISEGKRYPSVNLAGTYLEAAGTEGGWKSNWFFGLRLNLPLFDGGAIAADIGKSRAELMKARENVRALRLEIIREVRDAHLNIENAQERIAAAEKALSTATESARIENIRYKAGAGTTTDVLDAQTALLRADTDYYQALYDQAISRAFLRKAVGEDSAAGGAEK